MRFAVMGVTLIVLGSMLRMVSAQENEVSREAVVGWLRHQERLVRSVECRYKETWWPTRTEMIPLIRQLCGSTGDAPGAYIVAPVSGDKVSQKSIHWLRKGIKERMHETSSSGVDIFESTRVFDGQVVRSLQGEGHEEPVGNISTAERAHWWDTVQTLPFSFLYEFVHGQPYSEIVSHGAGFSASDVTVDGLPRIRVFVQHPSWKCSFLLLFDHEHRLVERLFQKPKRKGVGWYVREKHAFSDYEPYNDESGETIWFPTKAEYCYYIGEAPDGTGVEWKRSTFDMEQIAFNVEIPDETFVLEFPANAPVYDDLGGFGWITGAQLEARQRSEARRPLLIIVSTLPILILAVWFVAAKWKARRHKATAVEQHDRSGD